MVPRSIDPDISVLSFPFCTYLVTMRESLTTDGVFCYNMTKHHRSNTAIIFFLIYLLKKSLFDQKANNQLF